MHLAAPLKFTDLYNLLIYCTINAALLKWEWSLHHIHRKTQLSYFPKCQNIASNQSICCHVIIIILSAVVMPIILKTSTGLSSLLSLWSCSESLSPLHRISCKLSWDQGWQVKAIKFHWEQTSIYLGGHFDSKEIQPPCCQDLRGENIHFLSHRRKCKTLIIAKYSTWKSAQKENKSLCSSSEWLVNYAERCRH